MRELTDKQAAVLAFIRSYHDRHAMPPTRAEICAALGFASPNAAQEHLKTLAAKGAIELTRGRSRGIRLPTHADRQLSLPLVGRVAAGSPILAVAHIETHYSVSARLFSVPVDYLLRVHGTSMVDAGILDGDLLAVRTSVDVANGSIAVVRLDDEVTVKYFARHGQRVTLTPANPAFSPIEVDAQRDAISIEGIAAGVIRAGMA